MHPQRKSWLRLYQLVSKVLLSRLPVADTARTVLVPQGSVLEQIVARRHGMYTDDCQVYLSTSVEDVALAISKFAALCRGHQRLAECVQTSVERGEVAADGSSRLESAVGQGRLPTITVLGVYTSPSRRPLATSVLSIDRHRWQPIMSRWSVPPVHQLRPVIRSLSAVCHHQDARRRPGIHLVSSGLLQLTAVRHQRWTTSSPPVSAERAWSLARRRDHITPVLRQLHWLPVRQRTVFKIAGLICISPVVGSDPRAPRTSLTTVAI